MPRAITLICCSLALAACCCLPAVAEDVLQYRRLLQGEDGKKSAEMVKRSAELQATDKYSEAIEAAEQLLELRQRVQGADHHQSLDARWEIELLKKVGALPADQRAAWRAADAEVQKARALEQQGRPAQALPLRRRLLELRTKVLGDKHPFTGMACNNVASNLRAQGKYAEAEKLARQALEISRQAFGEAHPSTAICYLNVASDLFDQGKPVEGELLYRHALELFRSVLGEHQPLTGNACSSLAWALDEQGKHAEAEPLHELAFDILRAVQGEKHLETINARNNLAVSMAAQGKYAEAEHWFRQILATYRKTLGEAHPLTCTAYTNLAVTLVDLGRTAEAEPLYGKALEVQRRSGETRASTAGCYHNVAFNLSSRGLHAEAEPLLRKALEIRRQSLGPVHLATSQSCTALGVNLVAQGRSVEAEPLLREAVESGRRAQGEAHANMVHNYNNLGCMLLAQGRVDEALASLQAAASSYDVVRLRVSTKGLGRTTLIYSPYMHLAVALARAGRPLEAWQALEGNLARGLLDDFRATQPPAADRRQIQRSSAQLDDLNRQVARLLADPQALELKRPALDELSRQRAQADQELARLAAVESRRQVASLETVQQRLPADAALLVWIAPHGSQIPMHEQWACVVKKTGPPVWVPLPGTGADGKWSPADADLIGEIKYCLTRDDHRLAGWLAELRRDLHAQRLACVEPYLQDVTRRIILPAGVMAGIPIEALTDKYTISYAPSATLFAELSQSPRRTESPRLLAVGDPTFRRPEAPAKANQVASIFRGPHYSPLPGTRREVEAICRLFVRPDVLLGSDASEQKLVQLAKDGALKNYRILHVATHGQIDQKSAHKCALILAQDRLPDPLQQTLGKERLYDGKLDVGEILKDWQLDADLVVLSACETGLGRLAYGEGLMGFSQALLLKGARSLILSQWQVSDTATSLLMVRFYENWLGRAGSRERPERPLSKAEALKEAKHWLRNLSRDEAEKALTGLEERTRGLKLESSSSTPLPPEEKPFAHPYYWSAFILIGDPN